MVVAKGLDEFGLIRKFFAPLSGEGSLDLKDDVARLGSELIVSKDILVSGVHFFADDPPDLIARKALRVNISDVVAKGAVPIHYMLGCVFPNTTDEKWVASFADGLRQDQAEFQLSLLGGDTTKAPGNSPMVVSVTVFGKPFRRSNIVHRYGACAGDNIFVSGSIGDAGLGLAIRAGQMTDRGKHAAFLEERYLLPRPRLALAEPIAKYASASLDISDGLLADAGHLARASGTDLMIVSTDLPLSEAARLWVDEQTDTSQALTRLATCGDDYEVLCAVNPQNTDMFVASADDAGIAITQIGRCAASGEGAVQFVSSEGREIEAQQAGYNHFRSG
ncbi:thiamine-phosphate kinase [Parvularcula sp. IMCC14364]|uniref:thiamine-phosphate kinase n=1 Tax=Parvularcula sp. IMCC14364 TaxID=3067902 RepID=UPI0027412E9C|nr:thiamine-phosphate kinase [Parvularcula sp. IMCC14364]